MKQVIELFILSSCHNCICKVENSSNLHCYICRYYSPLYMCIWSALCMLWKPLEWSATLAPMTLLPWPTHGSVEKDSLGGFVCWWPRCPLGRLPVSHAGGVHPGWEVISPSFDYVPFFLHWWRSKDLHCTWPLSVFQAPGSSGSQHLIFIYFMVHLYSAFIQGFT